LLKVLISVGCVGFSQFIGNFGLNQGDDICDVLDAFSAKSFPSCGRVEDVEINEPTKRIVA
jgi:hypothetical protein